MIQAFLQDIHVGRPYLIPDHRHPVFELILVLAGITEVTVDGITTRAGPGDLLVFHPGRTHRESVHRGPFRTVVLRFGPDVLRVPIPQGEAVLRLAGDQRLRQTAAELAEEGTRTDDWSPAMQDALLTAFVIRLRRLLVRRPTPGWLDGTLEALASADGPARVDRLARSRGVAASTLRARVKAATGLPPRRYHVGACWTKLSGGSRGNSGGHVGDVHRSRRYASVAQFRYGTEAVCAEWLAYRTQSPILASLF